ncbi:MAG: class I SAM-dependent methyltransferase [bacterium]|nr:class I SAM-dependent methyltransferase [bacterium]
MDQKFNASYTDYWAERVKQLSDGTKIADDTIVELFLPLLNIGKADSLLDMGCSYGRFFPLLSKYSNHIYGIDIEASAISKASENNYQQLEIGALENLPFSDETFDIAFCWATFDCTEQEQALFEANRVLKKDGLMLLTGKNIAYAEDDSVAFIAERNAKLKAFPNHFTDIKKLYRLITQFGFSIEHGFAFKYRGDFGLANALPIDEEVLNTPFYEYALILKKTGPHNALTELICDTFSHTAKQMGQAEGYTDMIEFFKTHQEKYGI